VAVTFLFVVRPHAAVQDDDGSVLENVLLLVDTLTSLTAKPSYGSNLLPAKIYYFPLKTKFLGRFIVIILEHLLFFIPLFLFPYHAAFDLHQFIFTIPSFIFRLACAKLFWLVCCLFSC
jgi:hypothetical protein